MDSQEGSRWQFPTDAFVEILLRLPPNTRRLFRLVSWHWRSVVDESSLMFPQCPNPKTLVVTDGGSPFVVDDRTGRRSNLWTSSTPLRCRSMRIVDTSNGLVCLCDDGVPGGAITVANPVTGETLDVPPLPLPEQCHHGSWHQSYSFGYLPTTKRYKVVRLPCRFNQNCELPTLQVFTLGEESWREVVIPATSSGCNLDVGIVHINGTMYWIAANGDLMSFDLEEDCAIRVDPQPWMSAAKCFLTELHGRLGVVVRHCPPLMEKTEVWVMDNTQWSPWYGLTVTDPRERPGQRRRGYQRLTRPHFVQHTDHVLTWESQSDHVGLYKHKPRKRNASIGWGGGGWGGDVAINDTDRGMVVADIEGCWATPVFAYVENQESLSVYTLGDN